MTDPEVGLDWARVKELVADALELPVGERSLFLDGQNAVAPEILARARQLVAAASDRSRVVAAAPTDGLVISARIRDWSGQRVGPYTVVRFIARGGMGEVYEAVQEGTGRRVALKLLARDTQRDRIRFQQEGRLLGRLEHPNIASVLDADVHRAEDGSRWPYLALELVEGSSLTARVRGANVPRGARLELFREICGAVEHAHRKGVVHRDLKPDNILIAPDPDEPTSAGRAKVLDFGIAALANRDDDAATRLTRDGDLIGTLAYMAPEQVEAGSQLADARTDVYSLGVILFELLTERLPFDLTGRSITESLAILRELHSPLPSIHDRSLRGDLDTIVATALAKEPERRYPTAAALSADVERYLAHQPIEARPASRFYRAAKFARRHRELVGVTLLTLVLLSAAVVGTTYGLLRARSEARHARDVADFLGTSLIQTSPNAMGPNLRVRDLLEKISEDLPIRFADHPTTLAKLESSVGWAIWSLGDREVGVEHLERSASLSAAAWGLDSPESLKAARDAALTRSKLEGQAEAAVLVLRDLQRRARRSLSPSSEVRILIDYALGDALESAGQRAEGLELHQHAARLADQYLRESNEDEWGNIVAALAKSLAEFGRYDEALGLYRQVHDQSLETYGADHSMTLFNLLNISIVLNLAGRTQEAWELVEALDLAVADTDGVYSYAYLQTLRHKGTVLSDLRRNEEAALVLAEALEAMKAMHGEGHRDTLICLNNLAHVLYRSGRYDEASAHAEDLIQQASSVGAGVDDLANAGMSLMASVAEQTQDYARSIELVSKSIASLTESYGAAHPRTLLDRNNLARYQRLAGNLTASAAGYRNAMQDCEASGPDRDPQRLENAWNLAGVLVELERFDEAIEVMEIVEQLCPELDCEFPTRADRDAVWAELH